MFVDLGLITRGENIPVWTVKLMNKKILIIKIIEILILELYKNINRIITSTASIWKER